MDDSSLKFAQKRSRLQKLLASKTGLHLVVKTQSKTIEVQKAGLQDTFNIDRVSVA